MNDKKKIVLEFDQETPIPYYYQLQLLILNKIDDGSWKKGELMPPEREICEVFKVSRSTVRKAIENLVKMGVVKKIKGRGNIIIGSKEDETFLDSKFSFYDYLTYKGYDVKTRVLEFDKVEPPSMMKKLLRLNDNEKVFKLKRVRIVKEEPWYYEITYIPYNLCPMLVKEDLMGSLYKNLKQKCNLIPSYQRKYLFAVNAREIDSKLLNLKIGDPLQIMENINYLPDGTLSEYSINICRSDRLVFEAEVGKILSIEDAEGVVKSNLYKESKIFL